MAAKYLLDTNIVSAMARSASPSLMTRVAQSRVEDLAISIVSRGEIEFGLLRRPMRRDVAERMRGLLLEIQTLPLPSGAATRYAAMRHALESEGLPNGANDMWIAAHALADERIVVTANDREFRRVPGLTVENWLF